MSQPDPTTRGASTGERFYRPELDGLRFFAFLAVFVSHVAPRDPTVYEARGVPHVLAAAMAGAGDCGAFGVDLFFVLSAYLITTLLLREHDLRGSVDVRSFLARRALRIWPLFFAFLALSAGVDRLLLDRRGLSAGYTLAFVGFVGNWACAFFGWPDSVAAPLWSVSVEEQFYLLWPLVISRLGPRLLRPAAVALIAIAVSARAATVLLGATYPAVWASTLCRLDPIAAGVLVALWARPRGDAAAPAALSASSRVLLLLASLAIWGLVSRRFSVRDHSLLAVSVLYPCIALGATGILVASLGTPRGPFRVLASPAVVYLGRISYGLYVFHALAIACVGEVFPSGLGFLSRATSYAVALGLTVLLAAISYRFLERPFLRMKGRFTHVASREP